MNTSYSNASLDLYKVILAPLNTEKTNRMSDKHHRLVFKVAVWANKVQIKQAIEQLFNVNIEKVATSNVLGKSRVFKQKKGKKSDWKKAVVRLKSGQDINIADFLNNN